MSNMWGWVIHGCCDVHCRMCTVSCLGVSMGSTHYIPVVPYPPEVMTAFMFLDTAKCPQGWGVGYLPCLRITMSHIEMDLHVFPILIPPPTFPSTRSLWVFPVYQAWALVSCIQPGLVICFTLDNIHVSMLFSWNIPPSPSPTESKSLFYTSVSIFLFCIWGYH